MPRRFTVDARPGTYTVQAAPRRARPNPAPAAWREEWTHWDEGEHGVGAGPHIPHAILVWYTEPGAHGWSLEYFSGRRAVELTHGYVDWDSKFGPMVISGDPVEVRIRGGRLAPTPDQLRALGLAGYELLGQMAARMHELARAPRRTRSRAP